MVFLLGGFGNNLFQLALYFELLHRGSNKVKINTFFIDDNHLTRLLGWRRHDYSMTNKLLSNLNPDHIENRFCWRAFFSLCFYLLTWKVAPQFLRTWNSGAECLACGYLGYYQQGQHLNDKNFEELKLLVRRTFPARSMPASTVVIHARRGDFANLRNVSLDQQIRLIEEECSEAESVTIVSDDSLSAQNEISEVLENSKLKFEFISGSPEYDFATLLSAKTIVCSPSSYCYWASVLGDSERIFAPAVLSNGQPNTWQYPKRVQHF